MMQPRILYIFLSLFLLTTLPVSSQELTIPTSAKSRGIPAYPFPTSAQQPAGGTVELRVMGDGFLHWYETVDGYTVLQDSKKRYVYATHDADGNLVPSEFVLGERKGALAGISPYLRHSEKQVASLSKSYFPDESSKSNPSPFPATGDYHTLVILVEFPDRPASLPETEIDDLMNAVDYNGTGSFRDYYLEVSYGNLSLQSTLSPWVMMSENMSYYGANDSEGYDIRPDVLVREAVDSLDVQGFDFSPFDNDGDGYVDEIIVYHAGYGEHYIGSGDTCIWAHSYHLGARSVVYDEVILDNYIITSELAGNSGTNVAPVGIVAHEFAHSLGLPDMYDVDGEGSGGYAFDLNFWDLMAAGAWNENGHSPSGINSWMKSYLGWLTIPVIDTTGTFSLGALNEQPDAYQLNTPVYNEFFILENRQRSGFDRGLPGEDMLVYHVDLNYPGWLTGAINVDPLHQGFDLVEADDIRDTISIPGDPFPGTADVTAFDSLTTPSSNTWNGNASKVSLQNIVSESGTISFDILSSSTDQLPPDWTVDALSYTEQGTVTAMVKMGSDAVTAGYLGAFVGEECRGIRSPDYDPVTGHTLFELTVFSNTTGTETLAFRYYDPEADTTYVLNETLVFVSGTIAGSAEEPFVFVIDVVAPIVTSCPGNITVSNDPGACEAVVNYAAPVFEDDVDGTGLSGTLTAGLASGSLFPVGVTTVTYAYTDAAGKGPVECTFTVTVTDDEAATVVVCPSNITVVNDRGESGALVNYDVPLFADNCDGTGLTGTMVAGLVSGTQFPMGATTVTYSYTDAAGNSQAECTFIVTVNKGNYPPEVISPLVDEVTDEGFGSFTVNLAPVFNDPDGDELTFTAESSDHAVVTVSVSRSVLTVHEAGVGTADITVTAMDNGEGALEVSDVFTVSVVDVNDPPEVISPLADEVTDEGFGSFTVNLAPVFSDPDGDELIFTAASSDHAVITVSVSGSVLTIHEAGVGTADVTVTATDDGEGALEVEDQFVVTVNPLTSSADMNLPVVTIYPNPVRDRLFIEFGDQFQGELRLEVIDYRGTLVHIEKVTEGGKRPLQLDMQEFIPGLYFIRLLDRAGTGAAVSVMKE